MAVFVGPVANKFLFTNVNNLLNVWWPPSVKKLMRFSLPQVVGDEAMRMRQILMTSADRDARKNYVDRMDLVAQNHIRTHWEGKQELSCRIFASIDEPVHISRLAYHFDIFLKRVIHFPTNLPGTTCYRAPKAANAIKEEIRLIARQRRAALDKKMESHKKIFYSSGKFLSESEIVDNLLLLLLASHDTTTALITCVMMYLGELPEYFLQTTIDCLWLTEQSDITKSKEPGELLKLEDTQKMRYSWSVVSKVLRLIPPIIGAFREAVVDFTYAGYIIPKGWKLYWSPDTTIKDPAYFPNAEDFDPSRYGGAGPVPYTYVPFGGGPRMCLGYEYLKPVILVFLHNIAKRFKWDSLIPDEKVTYNPLPSPSQGLPIRLQLH
ncbi:unnamed protein product [Dovyalis caffra]|uniref:Cytochrome P450 n=1 Tax=Dovyalis caffra TaxID=77055 RepID=A0AAV1RUD9_9ROSI|nr:unnamed protein product [Dovyalis caffra]